MTTLDLSIIIVNWNSKTYLQKCIASVLHTIRGIKYEILVIDNASYDGTDEMLKQHYPSIHYIQSDMNLGFAKANNEAFLYSRGKYILFLNPDTEFHDNSIWTLYENLRTLPNTAMVGCKILNSDKTIQTSCIQAFPTILNQVFDSNALRRFFPRSRLWGMKPLFTDSELPTKVDAISGACLMINRSVFEDVGMFTTDYFMYSEDVDLCYKVRKAGQNAYYIPAAKVTHYGGTSSSQSNVSSFSSVMMMESRWRYFKKRRSITYAIFYRLVMCLASIVRIGVIFLISPIYLAKGRWGSIRDMFRKWAAKLRWAIGREGWVNQQ
ncbi:MAG: glycosyltransferase family 2 protein [Pseudomonadota bacterium]